MCAIVPAVAIDRQGFRLGYGGGYFDAFFAKYPTFRKNWRGVSFPLC